MSDDDDDDGDDDDDDDDDDGDSPPSYRVALVPLSGPFLPPPMKHPPLSDLDAWVREWVIQRVATYINRKAKIGSALTADNIMSDPSGL